MSADTPRHWCVALADRAALRAALDTLQALPPVAVPATITVEVEPNGRTSGWFLWVREPAPHIATWAALRQIGAQQVHATAPPRRWQTLADARAQIGDE